MQGKRLQGDARICQPVAQCLKMKGGNIFIGDDNNPGPRQQRCDARARLGQKARPDLHIVRA